MMYLMAGSGVVVLSLRRLAIGAVLVAIASLATLAIVVSVKNVDVLSTVALTLAILAFVVQIIVFIVQAAEANSQAKQGRELHGQMMSVLAQIQERTQGTQKSMDQMNSRMLEAIIGKAESEGISVGAADFAQRFEDALGQNVAHDVDVAQHEEPERDLGHVARSFWPMPLPAGRAANIHREMHSWPSADELAEVTSVLEQLSDDELVRLSSFAQDLERTTSANSSLGPGLFAQADENNKLKQLGLLEKVEGWRLHTLSPLGRRVGRIFTARESDGRGDEPERWRAYRERVDQLNREEEWRELQARRDG